MNIYKFQLLGTLQPDDRRTPIRVVLRVSETTEKGRHGRTDCCSDEATFHLNRYNARVWGSQIPHQFIQKERSADGKSFLCHFTAQKVLFVGISMNGHINLSFRTHWLVYAPPGSSLKMLRSVQCTYVFHKDLRKKLRLIN